jgi:hypothetical protein
MNNMNLPPEFEILARIADAEEPNVRELFQYALTMELVEDGKAKIVQQRTVGMREHLELRTAAGDAFTIVKPDISNVLLEQMREMVREVMEEGENLK